MARCAQNQWDKMKRHTIIAAIFGLAISASAAWRGAFDDAFFKFSPGGGSATNTIIATGGDITTNNGWIIHSWTNVGPITFEVTAGTGTVEWLNVPGGGGGGHNLGGGGGGYASTGLFAGTVGTYTGYVGDGGAEGQNGGNTEFAGITNTGGGAGASGWGGVNGGNGSSGGGAHSGTANASGGIGTAGNDGGNSVMLEAWPNFSAGGGGGAGTTGTNSVASIFASGDGGRGVSVWGSVYGGGGGGGGGYGSDQTPPGARGDGGGGRGGFYDDMTGVAGTPNTGGGGGGGAANNGTGGSGAKGVVRVRYPQ